MLLPVPSSGIYFSDGQRIYTAYSIRPSTAQHIANIAPRVQQYTSKLITHTSTNITMSVHSTISLVNSKGERGVKSRWYRGFCKMENDPRDDAYAICTLLGGTGSNGVQRSRPVINYWVQRIERGTVFSNC